MVEGEFLLRMAGRNNKTPVPTAKKPGSVPPLTHKLGSLPLMDHGGERTIMIVYVKCK